MVHKNVQKDQAETTIKIDSSAYTSFLRSYNSIWKIRMLID